jgi:hypothetical protein
LKFHQILFSKIRFLPGDLNLFVVKIWNNGHSCLQDKIKQPFAKQLFNSILTFYLTKITIET